MALTPEDRLDVLQRWAATRSGAGYAVPDEHSLRAVAQGVPLDEVPITPEVVSWLPTLGFLNHQMRMGVRFPDIPPELELPVGRPAPGASSGAEPATKPLPETTAAETRPMPETPSAETPAAAASADPQAEARFEALRSWRAAQLARNREGVSALKEFKLRGIARMTSLSRDQVRSMLSAGEAQFADEIGDVLDGVGQPAGSAAAVDEAVPAPVTPPAREPEREPVAAPAEPRIFEAASPSPRPAGSDSTAAGPVEASGFAPYALIPAGNATVQLAGVQTPDLSFAFSWAAFAGAPGETPQNVTIYRVVSSDEFAPYTPDLADVVGATTQLTLRDERPFTTAVRHVQVWANGGADEASARAAQPALHATGAFVAQPRDIEIREDEGRVIGQWTVWPGTSRVLVYRVPVSRAAHGLSNPQYQIMTESTNLGGFVDTQAERGARYLYAIVAEAAVDGVTQQSLPTPRDVLVSDVLEPVRDLRIEAHGGDDDRRFDLAWTAPAGGQVVVYRTEQPPQPGADREPLPEGSLVQTLLADGDRLAHPIEVGEEGARGMTDVPWPRTWTRAYFTPVTLLGGQAFVGTTVSHAGPRSIKAAKIVERVTKQILTFAWPEGAASVQIYGSAPGRSAVDAIAQSRALEVSLEQYKQAGGFTFPSPLPTKGYDVHLVPVAFHNGNSVQGAPTTVSYPGLTRLRYDLEVNRNIMRQVTGVTFSVHAVSESVDRPVVCVLVHNPERFPLSMSDGVALTVAAEELGGMPVRRAQLPNVQRDAPGIAWRTPSDTWKAESGGATGYVRLFVEVPADALGSVALLDPAASSLRVGKAGRFGV